MSFDLLDMSDSDFDTWLHDASRLVSRSAVSEDRLVELVSTTLREVEPEARARGFIDLANLCYAMADKTLGAVAGISMLRDRGKCRPTPVTVKGFAVSERHRSVRGCR